MYLCYYCVTAAHTERAMCVVSLANALH